LSEKAQNPRQLQSERDRLVFEIASLEKDILSIRDQLAEAEGTSREGTDWWRKASDARRHKERERRVKMARLGRVDRKLGRMQPDETKVQQKAALREVLRALFLVARTSLAYYEEDSELNELAFTDALDRLDEVVPDWDKPQPEQPAKDTVVSLSFND